MGDKDEERKHTAKTKKPSDKTVANDTQVASKAESGLKLPTIRKIHIKTRYVVLGVPVLLLGLFFARVAIWEHHYLAVMEGSERDTTTTSVYDGGEEIDDTEPTETEIQEYIVAPDKPRYFTIRSLGIYNARVVEVGLKDGDEMGTPRNAYDVGWYVNSVLPGSNGVTMLNAHGGSLGNGIFRNLPSISVGAEIVVEMGDGTKYTYIVHDLVTKNLGEEANDYMPTAFSSPTPGVASMTLITCTGDWLMNQQTYSQRLFVRALRK